MKEEILASQDHPKEWERLYRQNKTAFKKEFDLLYPQLKGSKMADVWHERLHFEAGEISWGSSQELLFTVVASLLAGLVAKIPDFFHVQHDLFFQRNIAFVVAPFLIAYFAWKNNATRLVALCLAGTIVVLIVYINLLPKDAGSDTLLLSSIHLPLLLWTGIGLAYVGHHYRDLGRRLAFLRYMGDLVVMNILILIGGMVLTMVTLGLFGLIQVPIENWYIQYVVVWGLAASPIVGTYLVQNNPQLVNKVSPVIAKVFTPLVLVTLVGYLFAIFHTGKDPYRDREFLLIFNVLLIGVMAIVLFSIAETPKESQRSIGLVLLFLLTVVTVVVNGIALSAIAFRIAEWGITPNRLSVLGGNVLMLANLLIVSYRLSRVLLAGDDVEGVGQSIARYLPIYSAWTMVVVFVFPVAFGFR